MRMQQEAAMRSLGKLLALVFLLACLAGPGATQPNGYQPYPRYNGYGVSSSNYYNGQLPPYLMGGPAYGYGYPNPYYGYCPYCPGPRSYIAPSYYPQWGYQPQGNMYSSSAMVPRQYPYYPPQGSAKSKSNSSPTAKETKPSTKVTYLPGKEPTAPSANATKTPEQPKGPSTSASSSKKSSLFRRMLYW
jgi:hypothetical protein